MPVNTPSPAPGVSTTQAPVIVPTSITGSVSGSSGGNPINVPYQPGQTISGSSGKSQLLSCIPYPVSVTLWYYEACSDPLGWHFPQALNTNESHIVRFVNEKLLTFLQQKLFMYLPYYKVEILMSR